MASMNDFAATGRILSAGNDHVVFAPLNSNYEWKLLTGEKYTGAIGQRVSGFIRVKARKVYTVPSGGNFVQPIFGPPRVIQGRLQHAEDGYFVVHGGAPFIVEWPEGELAIDLSDGVITVGRMINVMALPGAGFEPVGQTAEAQ